MAVFTNYIIMAQIKYIKIYYSYFRIYLGDLEINRSLYIRKLII